MTYLDLLNELRTLSDSQLNQDVTVYLTEQDEYFALSKDYPIGIADDTCDVLDKKHLYFRV